MATSTPLQEAVQQLASVVKVEWESDLPNAPAWFGPEGERVYENTMRLLNAVQTSSVASLLNGATVHEYLGASWLDCHGKAYDHAEHVQNLMAKKDAT